MDQPPKRPPHSQADDNKVTPQQGEKVAAATSRDKRTEEAMQSPNVTVEDYSNPRKKQRSAEEPVQKNPALPATDAATDTRTIQPALNVPLFDNHVQFPDQLWELLKHEELKDAIWWMPNNDAFAINERVFSAKLLESHFRGNKFSSIIRKLNRWGFRKYVDRSLPPKTVAYYHRSFQRGRPELIKMIEKEEGRLLSPMEGQSSQFSLFPEATTSQRITQLLQQGNPPLAAPSSLFNVNVNPAAAVASPGTASLRSIAHLTLGSPLNQRSQSSILQSIFGQRGASAADIAIPSLATATAVGLGSLGSAASTAGLGSLGSAASTAGLGSLGSAASSAGLGSLGSAASAGGLGSLGSAASAGGLGSAASNRTRELLRRSNPLQQLPLSQHANDTASSLEQQAILASMVNNIERERQEQQQRQEQSGRILLALERERSRLLVQEQKQEPLNLPQIARRNSASAADEASLFAMMAASHRQAYTGLQGSPQQLQQQQVQQVQQQEQQSRLLAAAACEENLQAAAVLAERQQQQQRGELNSQMQLHRQLQAAISSPNPFVSPLGAGRRVLGRDSIAVPAELLLTPQQQRVRQLLQLQQQQQQRRQLENELQGGGGGGGAMGSPQNDAR